MSQATLLQKKGNEMSLNNSLQYQINAVYNTCQSLPKKPSNLRNCKMGIQPLINNEENELVIKVSPSAPLGRSHHPTFLEHYYDRIWSTHQESDNSNTA